MTQHRLNKLCHAVLPSEFARIRRESPVVQSFLEKNLPDSVSQCVTLLTLNQDEIVIAASSPAVAGYLRMHSREIEQQLQEVSGFQQQLRICTVPAELLRVNKPEGRPEPKIPGADSVAAIRRNANWIDDENLRETMIALADSLETG